MMKWRRIDVPILRSEAVSPGSIAARTSRNVAAGHDKVTQAHDVALERAAEAAAAAPLDDPSGAVRPIRSA